MIFKKYSLRKRGCNKRINKNKLILLLISLYASTLINSSTIFGNVSLNHLRNGFKDVNPTLRLGDGYASYDNMSTGNTALNTSETSVIYSDLQNSINLSKSMSQTDLSKDLNVNVSANGGWGEFSASASANFLNSISNSQYSENITYGERFYANETLDISKLYGESALSAAGKQVYDNGINAFTARYGNDFILELPVGAIFLANIKLSFTSKKSKQVFDATASGSYGSIFSISTKVSNAIKQLNLQGNITVSAYQLGGDPSQLASIFTKSGSGTYNAVTCNFDNLTACKSIIGDIIDYAKDKFSAQIKESSKSGSAPQGNLAVVGAPITRTYASVFGLQKATPPSSDILKDRQQLGLVYLRQEGDKNIAEHLLDSGATLNKSELEQLDQNAQWNLALFNTYNVIDCYKPGEESSCLDIHNKVMANLRANVDSGIAKYKTAYVMSCNKDMLNPVAINIYSGYENQYFSNSKTNSKLAMSGQITLSADNQTLTYIGAISGPSSTPVKGSFSLNGNLYEGKMSNFPCANSTYIAKTDNPL